MRYIFDTSVWVALFLENDVHHKEALSIWNSLDGEVVLTYIVTAETASVLCYKHSKKQADKFLQFAMNSPRVIAHPNNFQYEAEFFLRFGSKASFADYAVLHIARTLDATLVTFDKQMRQMFKRIRVL
ncbi:MAG: hypothetical protein A2W52_00230 [Candidatus Taylorbacteria bacterium RIFCSPHIGHO2_02_49_25]|uniref:PIN domain-containing protein n=1 Tax=Candidatus Taylorbacteria bacterium RIFCSPHIGHO2_02_49_25 TaxID=1802305 RepID=A0A1G2MHF1_9BACT|nr:MAG: hypothetical protein A2947_01450 [Candidatus Peribacteria bacterium RIFCSPLOWO2_01_FULL_54_110]OHA19711.1 MAG: hypothetical protein A2759_03960 [Candidatus Taylorbacteria bacterium RIFCSPHIGHO2_01_FULL_49_60]OHA23144.1 MAG: hypothetical protein A2W52_00230 [Candidatus Taylorbacteria bacterium RIFCSPHIGHO2_02_49_25]OHA36159.1 MAG: hypothetical protein A2W65_02340 [Candidatus Taylorbacteria bacterium RIFCSPLOWO2_02_50_13]OHA40818.1 MAG: hypothetical protein A3H73_00460 [Candidatus Taylorb